MISLNYATSNSHSPTTQLSIFSSTGIPRNSQLIYKQTTTKEGCCCRSVECSTEKCEIKSGTHKEEEQRDENKLGIKVEWNCQARRDEKSCCCCFVASTIEDSVKKIPFLTAVLPLLKRAMKTFLCVSCTISYSFHYQKRSDKANSSLNADTQRFYSPTMQRRMKKCYKKLTENISALFCLMVLLLSRFLRQSSF